MRRIGTAQMHFFRAVTECGMTDELIREELGITHIDAVLKNYQDNWLQHTEIKFETVYSIEQYTRSPTELFAA
jgi:hypothetical protein